MARLPMLFSSERSELASLPVLPASTAVSLDSVYRYNNRSFMCVQAGTTSAGVSSTVYAASIATEAHDDTYQTLTHGTAIFRDITGHPDYGWNRAIKYLPVLYEVDNPNQVNSLVRWWRPTAGYNTVYFDSDCNIVTTYAGVSPSAGLALWGYWDVTNEVVSGYDAGSGSYTGMGVGQPPFGEFPSYVSVDAESPTYAAKKGATLTFDSIVDEYIYLGGYGYVEGFILNISGYAKYSGAYRTVCHLWFEDCEFNISGHLHTANLGRTDGSIGSKALYIDITYHGTPMEFTGDGEYVAGGTVTFESTYLSRGADRTTIYAADIPTKLAFVGVNVSGMVGDSPIVDSLVFCPRLEVAFDGCTGLRSAHLVPTAAYGDSTYWVEIVGGELDGVTDPNRYLLFTDTYSESATTAAYVLSSHTATGYGLATYKVDTKACLAPDFNFCLLRKFVSWAAAGVYSISLRFLAPDTLTLTPENLWVDVSTTGVPHGQVFTTRGLPGLVAEDTTSVWVKPSGFTAYRATIHATHDIDGAVCASLYCAIPSTTLYISGSLDVVGAV